jgi:hypothetical protein
LFPLRASLLHCSLLPYSTQHKSRASEARDTRETRGTREARGQKKDGGLGGGAHACPLDPGCGAGSPPHSFIITLIALITLMTLITLFDLMPFTLMPCSYLHNPHICNWLQGLARRHMFKRVEKFGVNSHITMAAKGELHWAQQMEVTLSYYDILNLITLTLIILLGTTLGGCFLLP